MKEWAHPGRMTPPSWSWPSAPPSLSALAALASNRLHWKYPPVVLECRVQSCMQIQQNSCRHLRQLMWLHPSSFSMAAEQRGHFLVFAATQSALARYSPAFISVKHDTFKLDEDHKTIQTMAIGYLVSNSVRQSANLRVAHHGASSFHFVC